MPALTVIAGPNGSGKSSIFGGVTPAGHHLDPDAVAKRINPEDPYRASVAAGREVIQRTRHYLAHGEDFIIETTLSSASTIDTMRTAKERGFLVHLLYVCVDDPERNIKRVRERAARGGHFVPDADVRRRYERSLANLTPAIQAADVAILYDNSGARPHRVLEVRAGIIVWRSANQPSWLQRTIPGEHS